MINSQHLKTVVNTLEVRKFTASKVDGKWYGRRGTNIFPINVPENACDKYHYIFSTASNSYWPYGTLKRHDKLHKPNYVDKGFWDVFRDGIEFKGTVINGIIHPDWNNYQKQLAKILSGENSN